MKNKIYTNNNLAQLVNKLDGKVDILAELVIGVKQEVGDVKQEVAGIKQEVEDLAIMTAKEFERQNNNLADFRAEVKAIFNNHEVRITELESVRTG